MSDPTWSPRADYYFSATPVKELDQSVICESCEDSIFGFAYYDGGDYYYCDHCAQTLTENVFGEAEAHAEQECRIARELPSYDPAREYFFTREKYWRGNPEPHSPEAYHVHCRQFRTNFNARGRIFYDAIWHRIDEMLSEHKDYMHYEDDEDEE